VTTVLNGATIGEGGNKIDVIDRRHLTYFSGDGLG